MPHIAVTDAAVWVVNPDLSVSRIDPRTNRVVAGVAGVLALSIAAGEGEVWIVNDRGEVVEIDPRTNAASKTIPVPAESLTGARRRRRRGLGRRSRRRQRLADRPRPGADPAHASRSTSVFGGVAFGEGAVWATNEIADEVYRIDPDTNEARVVSRMAAPRGIAVGEGAVWVTSAGPPSAEEALPASSCSKLFYGGAGSPRFLVASDLPLQGQPRAATLPMTEAIRFVLEQRDFRAGPYTVGYQSCDDSTAQAGDYDPYKCFSNAKAYARNLAVIGVIGPYNSGCAARPDPDCEPGPRRGLGHDQPLEHVDRAHAPLPGHAPGRARGSVPVGRAELRPHRGRRPPAGRGRRPASQGAGRAAPVRPHGPGPLLRYRRKNGGAEPRARDRRLHPVERRSPELRAPRPAHRPDSRRRGLPRRLPLSERRRPGSGSPRPPRSRRGPCRPRPVRPRPGSDRGRGAGGTRDVPQRLRRAERRAPTPGQAVPRGVRSHPSRRAEPVVRPPRTPPRRPRSCSTRSPAPTARARR